MRIRKLEMMGFKSFSDRTVVQFGDGISCIVGPNGCGKSNIIDALRWCIGEQSAKKLRGSEMMDVIFAGSSDRKAVGYAEVAMTLSADDGKPFPGEYREFGQISVGRRLHRSGQSEYFVNQSIVRRRDVVDLFLDTGIGNNLYSFIEQGRIGEIVQARPEQRRGLIDEAAGIAKYKIRRDEAQKRLESTATQLDRAADVADEMGRRVRTLARQVLKAASFRRTRALIRQNEIALSLAKYANLAAERRSLRNELRDARNAVARIEREIARKSKDIDERKVEIAVIEEGVDRQRDTLAEHDATVRAQESSEGFLQQKSASLIEQRARLDTEKQRAVEDCEHARVLIESTAESLTELIQTQTEQRQAFIVAKAEKERQEQIVSGLIQELRQAETAFLEEQARLEALAASRAADEERLAWLPEEIGRCAAICEQLDSEQAERDAACETTQADIIAAEQMLQQLARTRSSQDNQMHQGQQAVQDKIGALQEARQQLADQRRSFQEERVLRQDRAQAARDNEKYIQSNQQKERRIWMRTVLEESRTRLSLAREDAEDTQQEQFERLRQWCDAQSSHWFYGVQQYSEQRQIQRKAARHRLEQDALEREQKRQRRFDASLLDLERTHKNATDEIKRSIAECMDVLKQSRQNHGRLTKESVSLTESLANARARLNTLREAEKDVMSADVIQETVGAPQYVFETMDSEQIASRLPLLNQRVVLPMVETEEDVLALHAKSMESGPVQLLWNYSKDGPVQRLLDAVTVVESMQEALAVHKSTGSAVVVRGSGDRISQDGVVELGFSGRAGAALMRAADDRRDVQEEVNTLRARFDACALDLSECAQTIEDNEASLQRYRSALETLNQEQASRLQSLRGKEQEERKSVDAQNTQLLVETMTRFDAVTESVIGSMRAQMDAAQEKMDAQRRALMHDVSERTRSSIEGLEREEDALVQNAEEESDRRAKSLVRQAEQEVARAEAALVDWEHDGAGKNEQIETRLETCQQALSEAQDILTQRNAALAELVGQQTHAEFALKSMQDDLASAERESLLATTRRDEISVRLKELESELAERSNTNAVDTDIQSNEAKLRALQDTLNTVQEKHEEAVLRQKECSDQVTQCSIDIATLDERRTSLRTQSESAEQMRGKATQRLHDLERQIKDNHTSTNTVAEERQTLDDAMAAEKSRRAGVWDMLQKERERLTERKSALEAILNDVREAESRRNAAQTKLTEHERSVQETQGRIEAIRQRMDERYQVSLTGLLDRLEAQGKLDIKPPDTVLQDVEIEGKLIEAVSVIVMRTSWLSDAERIQSMVSDLEGYRAELNRIGEVNLMALDEYEDVRQRHAELEAQRSDLEASIQRIRAAIAKMNRTCREQFRETFDEVNEAFQEMYPALVGGGRARLSLTNEDDLLETGVDIFVQPPGKRLQNLNLLSGGEKAMAAIGLIMALFKVKPSPFCVLDEVDAPLDEGNGTRFNAAIRQMSKHSQFILVTHNRKTMECADTLLGITMPVPGVSKLVSVNLDA